MKKRFRVYFKTNESIILIILVILLAVVIGILLWRAQEALTAVGIFFGVLFLLFLVAEAKCFHFLKITERYFIFSICGIRVAKLEIDKTYIRFGEITEKRYGSRGAFIFSESGIVRFHIKGNIFIKNIMREIFCRRKDREKYYYCIFTPALMQALEKVYKKSVEITPQTFSWISKDFPKQKRAVEEYNEKISENAQ